MTVSKVVLVTIRASDRISEHYHHQLIVVWVIQVSDWVSKHYHNHRPFTVQVVVIYISQHSTIPWEHYHRPFPILATKDKESPPGPPLEQSEYMFNDRLTLSRVSVT